VKISNMIYPENFENKIGFDRIRDMIAGTCMSTLGKTKAGTVSFMTGFDDVLRETTRTSEFQQIINFEEGFPSDHYYDVTLCLNKIRIEGSFPDVSEVYDLKRSLETIKSILNFFKNKDGKKYPELLSFCSSVKTFPFVLDTIDRIIDRNGEIKDNASKNLKDIRSELQSKTSSVTKRLHAILKLAQSEGIVDQDITVAIRNGRGVIPVSAYDKRKIKGLIHDQSATGKTVYIEPAEIVELNNDIIELEYDERREIARILTALADEIRPYIDELVLSNDFLGEIDFIRAKALLGIQLGSIKPRIIPKPYLGWRKAIHPLLHLSFIKTPGRKVVPLDIHLNEDDRILLISGPNAGGKSVCLKTVGLLQYMLQCGFTIPVSEGSETGIFRNIFIDIGDEQSIDNDLSTYSSHLINMKHFIKSASDETLILIDEFGTGTEPMLGGAIAEAILGALNKRRVYGVLTTHYTNLKHFASLTSGIVNGAMAFDNHLMQPLFQLYIGRPGSSFAFEIARKIGLPDDILNEASKKAGVENINYDRNLKDIARDKRYWEKKRQSIRDREKKLEELIEEYEKELSGTKSLRKEIISKAKDEAQMILKDSNKMIESTIRQIKEARAEKEKTKDVRQQFEEFKNTITADPAPETIQIDAKIERLREKEKRIRPIKVEKKKTEINVPVAPLKPGDPVRMKDTLAAGEIIEIKDNIVHVGFGNATLLVPLEKVERIDRDEFRKQMMASRGNTSLNHEMTEKRSAFKPEIDLRGMRAEEALTMVQTFIDDAILVQYRNLRILHGKGNGILRQLVRQYLSTTGIVKSYRDEHVEFGGAGITVIELDL
jgi:DNA mismatch repair protein MutS2